MKGQSLQESLNNHNTIPDKKVIEIMEAMKIAGKLREAFQQIRSEFTFESFDQSGPFQSQIIFATTKLSAKHNTTPFAKCAVSG